MRITPTLALALIGLATTWGACDDSGDDDDTTVDDDDSVADDDDSADDDDDDSADDDVDDDDSTDDDDTSEPPSTIEIDPSDPGLRYVGRWSFDDPSAPSVGWQGASVALHFVGTDLDVTMDPGDAMEPWRVVVDGDQLASTRFSTSPVQDTYTIAAGLTAGEHTVELVKETYADDDAVIRGFTLNGWGLLDAPADATRRLEFYGDSNLAGYSLMSEQNQGGLDRQGSHFTYAGATARAFGADYHNLSVSGETLGGMPLKYDRQSLVDPTSIWDFGDYPADVVVMNLGANDLYYVDEATIRQRYTAMLDLLRATHPTAHIVVFNAQGWDADEPANYTGEVVDGYGNPDVTAATFPWFFEQWHGCEYDHGGMARTLIAHLEDVMGWTSTNPALMSGFGLGGDVANGGFEQVAPFGGYGWRYYTDAGVSRIEDANEAHSGDAYVRLDDGAAIHQPNPATDGDTVEVTLWMRAATTGNQVDLTIDFRGQTMWTTPLQTTTETRTLTTAWEAYSMAVEAHPAGLDPVFHTRLTIEAHPGATVEVDDVSMTVTPAR